MNEIIKKIVEEIEDQKKIWEVANPYQHNEDRAYLMGLQKAKELTQAEQKECGCYICNDTSNDRYYRNKKYRYCPHCGCNLNNLPDKIKTKGDVIRESNFRLANMIYQVTDCKKCLVKDGCEVTNQFACYSRWCDYLNRPVEE